MVRIAAILFLSLLTCIGSDPRPFTFSDQAFLQAALPSGEVLWAGYPTNISGCLGWWSADNGYSQASGLATWLNYSSQVTNASSINLTNQASGTGTQPTAVSAYLNGHSVLYFDGTDDYLKNVNYATVQPHEVWLVLKKTNYAGTTLVDVDSVDGANRNAIYNNSGNMLIQSGGALPGTGGSVTNKFFVVTALFNGLGSQINTNNVSNVTGSAGLSPIYGITVGARYSLTLNDSVFIAELITFTNTLNTATRSNLFSYLTNKYAITVP